jgi:outer membrane protein assembly factor BamA
MKGIGWFLLSIPLLGWGSEFQLGEIALFGNTVTKPGVIFREMKLKPGQVFSDSLMNSDRAWIIRCDFLNKIDFQLKTDPEKQCYHLLIIVREKGHWSFAPSFHTNDLFGLYGGGILKYRNLLGLRQTLGIQAEAGGKNQVRIFWTNPWWGKPHLFSRIELIYEDQPYSYSDFQRSFNFTRTGISLTMGQQIRRALGYGFRMTVESVRTDQPIRFSGRENQTLKTGVFLQHDTRDWPAYPRHGYLFEAAFDHIQSNRFDYEYALLNARTYIPQRRNDILALQCLIQGYLGTIPVYERLHLGGGDTVRGLPTGFQAGDRLVMVNCEYRFPIMYERNFRENVHIGYAGVLFFDMGTAWFAGEWQYRDLHSAVGIGVHALWGNTVIRGEYGTRGKGWGFINVGTSIHF